MKIITKENGHTHVLKFNLEATCKVPEFERYYRLRESNPKISAKKWEDKFDKDMLIHFELAYSSLKEVDNEL